MAAKTSYPSAGPTGLPSERGRTANVFVARPIGVTRPRSSDLGPTGKRQVLLEARPWCSVWNGMKMGSKKIIRRARKFGALRKTKERTSMAIDDDMKRRKLFPILIAQCYHFLQLAPSCSCTHPSVRHRHPQGHRPHPSTQFFLLLKPCRCTFHPCTF
jgi:hypothetical protein